ncbi:hypothetical protein OH76DRAFT_226945 [Lentinus brumalis]|uniref:Uncharacterized protein n=1 Tax=Lentinus brumalis TaxID=2498619 RepID=A0A371DH91_9APHY|nr:hypothetical protein OH76DRAFT_226945 [Polyporus brumalis]
MGAIFSAIGGAINAVVSAIANHRHYLRRHLRHPLLQLLRRTHPSHGNAQIQIRQWGRRDILSCYRRRPRSMRRDIYPPPLYHHLDDAFYNAVLYPYWREHGVHIVAIDTRRQGNDKKAPYRRAIRRNRSMRT